MSKKEEGRGELEALAYHDGPINCIVLSEDGSLLLTGSDDKTIRMWCTNAAKTECIGTLSGHTKAVKCLSVFDNFVISGSVDTTVRKWDMTTLECVFVYRGHSGQIAKVICSPEFVFSVSADKTARCW